VSQLKHEMPGIAVSTSAVDQHADPGYAIALARRAQNRDARAWEEIYETHYPAIYRYVHARVEESAVADIAAEVFAGAVASISGYSGKRPLLAWLYGIARHRVADYHRRAKRREPFIARFPLFGAGAGYANDSSFEREQAAGDRRGDPAAHIERLDLNRALDRLTAIQREVVLLRYFVGLTTPEISAALAKDPAAIYSLEARALQKLRRELRADDQDVRRI
jgi:RNA polymerase sigma-70 factor (ECF subfamily)